MSSAPLISILTVNWNGAAVVRRWLANLETLDYPREQVEIVIHDNASTDGSQAAIREVFGSMERQGWRRLALLEAREHPGLCRAYNNAFLAADTRSEFILQIDNDVRLDPGAINSLVDVMRREPTAAIVGCRVVVDDAARTFPLQRGAIMWDWWAGHHRNIDAHDVCECDAILDCVMMVRRAATEAWGAYFDESLFFFCLGSDLCMRARRHGQKVMYQPKATAFHKTAVTTGRHPRLTKYLSIRDGMIFGRRHNRFLSRQLSTARTLMFAVKELCTTGDTVALRATIDGYRERPFDIDWWRHAIDGDAIR